VVVVVAQVVKDLLTDLSVMHQQHEQVATEVPVAEVISLDLGLYVLEAVVAVHMAEQGPELPA
jgi:hypothetical protein